MTLKVGSHGQAVTDWQQWFHRKYASYAPPVDGYFGYADRDAVRILQGRLGVPVTGEFDDVTAARAAYPGAATAQTHRPIWIYTAPGSGADWWIGPPFEVGTWCQDTLKINHQPVGFPKGGYLGLMGGDPALSYDDVIASERNELRRLIATCPDLANPNVEFWFSAYSQSADGMVVAVNELFGDGGEFAHLRSRINGLILFGNPATAGTGIARKTFPAWVNDLTRNVNMRNDFYAVAPDKIRPLFYEWFVKAETELPFVVYTAQIVIPALLNFIPIIGGLAGPFAPLMLAAATGMSAFTPLLTSVIGGVNGAAAQPNPELIALLSAQGLLTSLPDLLGLITALPGLQAHGEYHLSKPDFGGRTGIQVGCDIVASFRR